MIFMMAVEQEYDIEHGNQNISGYNDACALFINSCSSCSSRNDFGGGCEMSLHADKVVAAAETYMGLIWRWVIPGGGGSKEMALRASDLFHKMTWN
jgi:3-hydroxyacyl-CoA dehydrogenase